MNLKKMLMLASMALAAMAAIPAIASAQSDVLREGGSDLQAGDKVTATSSNLTTTTEIGTLECEQVTIHGEVLTNSPTSATIGNNTVTVSNPCTLSPLGLPVIITEPAVGTITLGEGSGSAQATFVSDIGESQCHFEGTVGFTYETGDVLNIPGSVLTGSGEGCPSEGEMKGDFTLETSDGTAVTVH